MSLEGPSNGENGSERIVRELSLVHEKLAELEAKRPQLHEDITAVQTKIKETQEYMGRYDEVAEGRADAGTLPEDLASAFAQTISDLEELLQNKVQEEHELLEVKAALDTAVDSLRRDAERLLARLPRRTEH